MLNVLTTVNSCFFVLYYTIIQLNVLRLIFVWYATNNKCSTINTIF